MVWCEYTLRWRHNESDGISNHQHHDCLLNRLFRHRSKKTWKLRVTGLCVGNSPGTGEFPAQMASSAENVSISWRYHDRLFNIHINVHQNLWRYMASTGHAYMIDHIMVWLGNVWYNVFQHQPETCLLVTLGLWHMVDPWIGIQWKQIIDARGQSLHVAWAYGVMTWKRFPHYWPFVWGIHRLTVNSHHKRTGNAELWCFTCCNPEQAVKQLICRSFETL